MAEDTSKLRISTIRGCFECRFFCKDPKGCTHGSLLVKHNAMKKFSLEAEEPCMLVAVEDEYVFPDFCPLPTWDALFGRTGPFFAPEPGES